MLAAIFAENPLTTLDEQLYLDPLTKTLVTIDIGHYITHRGRTFLHSGELSVAAGASFDHLIVVPLGTTAHLQEFVVDSTVAPIASKFYEAPVTSANGTSHSSVNFNRTSSNVAAVLAYHAPTVTDVGTILHTKQLTGNKSEGGSFDTGGYEFILTPGQNYLHRLTNNSNQTATITYYARWYEFPL